MASVAWAYDGGTGGTGVITATITGATIGWQYKLGFWGGGGNVTDTAVSSTLVLQITNADFFGGQWISWVGDDHGDGIFPEFWAEAAYPIDTAIFAEGITTEAANDPSVTVTYDGNKTVTLTTTHTGGCYFQVGYVDLDDGNDFTEDSISPTGPGSFNILMSGTPIDTFSVDVEFDPTFYDVYGHGVLAYTGPLPIFLEAEDDYNSDPLYADTVTASGNTYVTLGSSPEDYDEDTSFDLLVDQGNCHPQFFIQSDRLPPAGRYTISLKMRGSTNGTNTNNTGWIVVRRNGLSITPSFFVNSPNGADQWFKLNQPWPTDNSDDPLGTGPESYPFLPGDVYEFCLFDQSSDHSMAVDQIRLDQVQAGGSSKNITMLAPPEYATGSTWTDVDGMTDATKEPDYLDMCITDDGTIYGIWSQNAKSGSRAGDRIVVRSFDGSSWTTISSDLAGLSAPPNAWIKCATDGVNVYFLYGQNDGTSTGGISNSLWHLKKWDGSSLTELGTGQRQIVSRTTYFADLCDDALTCNIYISPSGVPWVFWLESPDSTAQASFPHAWYWNGSSWTDTSLTPNTHIHTFYDGQVVSNCNAFGVVFSNTDGTPSENPFVIWGYQDGQDGGGDGPARLGFDLQKWNGSSWDSILDFAAVEVFPDLRTLDITPPLYHWHQGIHMFVWQNQVWFSAAFGFFGSGTSQAGIAALASDMSAFVPPENPYWDRPYWNSVLPPNSSESIRWGWGDGQTTGIPIVDADGNLWIGVGTFFTGYDTNGPTIIGRQENGSGNGWTLAWRDPIDTANGGPNGGMYGEFQFMEMGFAAHGNTLYALLYASKGSDDPILLYKIERDDDYAAWFAGGQGTVNLSQMRYRVFQSA